MTTEEIMKWAVRIQTLAVIVAVAAVVVALVKA
jgi:hypothetical protein